MTTKKTSEVTKKTPSTKKASKTNRNIMPPITVNFGDRSKTIIGWRNAVFSVVEKLYRQGQIMEKDFKMWDEIIRERPSENYPFFLPHDRWEEKTPNNRSRYKADPISLGRGQYHVYGGWAREPFEKFKKFINENFPKVVTISDISDYRMEGTDGQEGAIDLEEYCTLLMQNHQLILTGAPGTGKTFMARQLAEAMLQGTEEKLDHTDSTNQFKFVQFHPGYDYSDFVIGLKPKLVGQQVVFEWEDGVFKKLCDTAKKASEKKFVMVIDEINRADLSRVFGELFFCLEENYRGKEIDLPNGESFTIPENVYIIGTMNDIDRSVESMDFALRRRFAWREVKADDTGEQIIRSADKVNETDKKTALEKMIAVNVKLGELGFGEEYKLGGAYFKKIEKYTSASDKWTCLWDNHIKVILQEYLRGRRDANTNLEDLKKAYDAKAEKNSEEKQ